jgi:superfamily II DNA or RNA helicase
MREGLEGATYDHSYTPEIVSITSDTPRKEREEILARGYEGEYDYILSTTLANEGLDWPPLRSICLAFPGRYEGTVIQQTGRVSRPYPGKTQALILDYVDQHGITRSQARDRLRVYVDQDYKPCKVRLI